MTSAVAVKVNGVVMTSSPGPRPSAHSERWSAPVQCATAIALRAPTYLANSFSNRFALGPVVIHPERKVSMTSRSSSGPIEGRWNGTWRMQCVLGASVSERSSTRSCRVRVARQIRSGAVKSDFGEYKDRSKRGQGGLSQACRAGHELAGSPVRRRPWHYVGGNAGFLLDRFLELR